MRLWGDKRKKRRERRGGGGGGNLRVRESNVIGCFLMQGGVLCGLEYVLQLLIEEMWGEESEMRGRTTRESKTKKFELAIRVIFGT